MTEWKSIEDMPKDGTVIQRWHTMWKAPISVKYVEDSPHADKGMFWIEATLAMAWPEEAFTPHYADLPKPPVTND